MFLRHQRLASHPCQTAHAFTLVEAMVALSVLALFIVSSTVTLNLFNNNAAKNRNGETARALMENYVGLTLAAKSNLAPTNGSLTVNGLTVDPCTAIGEFAVPQNADGTVSLVVGRGAGAAPVVTGNLYWRVKNLGASYGIAADNDLVQIDFVIKYTYRGQTYYYSAQTLKANS